MIVTSAQNPQLKLVKRLQRRRTREQEGLFVVEGEDLVGAGLETGAVPRVILVDAERPPKLEGHGVTCPVLHVDPKLLADVSELAHAPRILGVFELLEPAVLAVGTGPWLVLDAVADPGNVGTIIRAAAALGAGGVALRPGSGDPWSGKALRASMGSAFRVPIVQLVDPADLARAGLRVVALDAGGDVALSEAALDPATAIVVGSERDGVSDELRAVADLTASIPQDPAVESLNAGVAAALALYEWRRA